MSRKEILLISILTYGTRKRPRDYIFRLLLALSAILLVPCQVKAQTVSETEIKAAFIYNSAKFTEWPKNIFSDDDAPINLMVLGDEDFTSKLTSLLKGKKAHGRSFQVKRVVNPGDAKNAQILFVPAGETKRFPSFYEVIKKTPVLTIGESAQFLDQGGIINLVFEDDLLRFEIHPESAERANLVISSRLMRLAKNIRKGEVKE
ncbi:MAG: YfiR family protein [Verrucomicrobiota bacterium]